MHKYGINMRYLSHISVLTQVPHVRDLCVTEMLARTFKNIVNTQMSELVLDNKLEHRQLEERREELDKEINRRPLANYKQMSAQKYNEPGIEHDPSAQQTEQDALEAERQKIIELMQSRESIDMNKETHMLLVDMLNLVFGCGEETDYFWDEILFKQCSEHFGIDEAIRYHENLDGKEEILSRERVNLNALFYAIVYLMGIKIKPFEREKKEEPSRGLQ